MSSDFSSAMYDDGISGSGVTDSLFSSGSGFLRKSGLAALFLATAFGFSFPGAAFWRKSGSGVGGAAFNGRVTSLLSFFSLRIGSLSSDRLLCTGGAEVGLVLFRGSVGREDCDRPADASATASSASCLLCTSRSSTSFSQFRSLRR